MNGSSNTLKNGSGFKGSMQNPAEQRNGAEINLVFLSVRKALGQKPLLTIALLLLVIAVVVTALVPPWILKRIIDVNLAKKTLEGLSLLAAAYIAAVVLTGVFDFLKEAILTVFGQRIMSLIRNAMVRKLDRLPPLYFSKNDSGTIMSRFTNDVDMIGFLFTGGVVGMAVDSLRIIGIIASISFFSGRLGILTILLLPLIGLITRFFRRHMLGAQSENRVLTGKINGHISESLKNGRMIRSFHREEFMERRYTGLLAKSYYATDRINFYNSVFPPIIQIIRAGIISLIVVLASQKIHILGISVGMVAATIELISGLFSPIENLGMEFQSIQGAVAGVQRVNEFYNTTEDEPKDISLNAAAVIPDRNAVTVRLNDLAFSYDEKTEVLRNITLTIPPLEKVTVTGRTGVGKTTLFKLVLGLLKPGAGSVTVNGIDVYRIPDREKKQLFGYVDQSCPLIRGTVVEQITLKDPAIPREAAMHALEVCGLTDFVAGLENGADTVISGSTQFSQGQKQLLAIARALVTDPPILLLDEMTANLDSVTEQRIMSILQKVGAGRTIFAISHRPSSMMASDRIVILENGHIRASGRPDELAEHDEWFRSRLGLERHTWDE